MHIEFLVEEESCEAALHALVPRILPDASFTTHAYQGKPDLLRRLPERLRGYARWLPADWRIVILLDADDPRKCQELKEQVERTALEAGLHTKSRPADDGAYQVMTRLAIEELEAWFFSDTDAVRKAYPRVPANLGQRASYREPNGIRGGTAEALERVLLRAGYHRAGLPKIAAARAIAQHMCPSRNRSRSFQVFRRGLLAMAGPPAAQEL